MLDHLTLAEMVKRESVLLDEYDATPHTRDTEARLFEIENELDILDIAIRQRKYGHD